MTVQQPVQPVLPEPRAMTPRLSAWYRAARPRSLTATYIPLALAGVIALDDGLFNLVRFILALIGALALQIGANLVNEYVDYTRGTDAEKQAGMGMVLKSAALTPRMVLYAAIFTISVGVVIGLALTVATGPIVLWIGIGGVLVVILYTAGPLPLSHIGLGEIAVLVFMGPLLVLGGYYVTAGQTSMTPVLASLPIAFLVAAILHANNVRDLEADRAARKRTLAVIFGRRFARAEYFFWLGGSYLSLILLVAAGQMPWLTLAALGTIQESRHLVQLTLRSEDTPTLHLVQVRTAQLHRDFGILVVVGWLATLLIKAALPAIR